MLATTLTQTLHCVVDANIPRLAQWLRALGCSVVEYAERSPSAASLQDCQALFVRSVTKVTADLLDAAPDLRWLATATIGTDHLDQQALEQRGIAWCAAAGANAEAVGQYILNATVECLLRQAPDQSLPLTKVNGQAPSAAIVGAGHTGQAAGRRLAGLGFAVHYYDPPLLQQTRLEAKRTCARLEVHADWQRVLQADVISLHVPLTRAGEQPTYHLFDAAALAQLAPNTLLLNASRGPVIEQQALLTALQRQPRSVVLDVWEFEPQVEAELVAHCQLATAHIAGHSLEGKIGGAKRVFEAFCRHFELLPPAQLDGDLSAELTTVWTLSEAPTLQTLATHLRAIYDVREDDARFRQQGLDSGGFDRLRKEYPARRQQSVMGCTGAWLAAQPEWRARLQQLDFTILAEE